MGCVLMPIVLVLAGALVFIGASGNPLAAVAIAVLLALCWPWGRPRP